jgi:glycosyltransferase involved in cell wall biosynthesis
MSQVADLAAPSAVVWAPRIPLVGAAIANLLAVIPVVRFRPDVILVNPGLAVAGALCALLLRRAAIVADVRSVPVNPPGSLAARVGDLEFRLAMHLPRLSAVTAITAGTASLLRARYGLAPAVPITIWGSGANVALFNPEVRGVPREAFAPPNRILICYHGHLSLARGLGTLIDALAVARRSEPRLHLILLGGGKDLSALRERVLRAGLEEYVTFLAPVPIADVPGYLAACDGAVIPLPDEVIWRVSSPLKLYEDLAMGLPVLATDIEPHRGFGDLITLCSPDILGIAAGLLKLAGDAIAHERSPRRADLQSLSWAFPARHLSEGLERSIGI